ncbi:MAG: 2,3-diphosphoglycerate synthetase, partial [Actinomycetota bacterium]|nr:2,3-diphosphoglycerate synthetase [Actinomycetota bacterium]
EYLRGYFGPYRLGLASVVVVLEAEDQGAHGPADEIAGLMSGLPNLRGRMVPQPLVAPEGRRVALVTTAHPRAGPHLAAALEAEGAEQVTVVHGLGDRRRLREELEAASDADLVLVEVKAAAVDVVLPWAEGRGKQVAFVHNRVVLDEGIERLTGLVEQRW